MWFKNLQIYRIPAPWAISSEQLEAFLVKQVFSACSSLEMQAQGWISPRDNGQLVHTVNRQMLLALRTEKKLLPASVINQVTKERAAEIEEQQGFAPGRKQLKDLKEQVTDELLPKAFSTNRTTWTWIDPVNGWLVVDASGPSRAEEVLKLLLASVDQLQIAGLRTVHTPLTSMTDWLVADEAPSGFTVDQDTELRATSEGKATVRYIRHTLEADDTRRHIAAGKQCTRLAMTWADHVSFVLTEGLAIKRITPLDVLKEAADGTSKNDDERFDSDMVLMTGELNKLLNDLVEALGGEPDQHDQMAQRSEQVHLVGAGKMQRAVKMTAKLYEARDSAKFMLGEKYPERMEELGALIRVRMVEKGESEIGAASFLCTQTENSYLQIEILAAAVEMVEPSVGVEA